MQDDRNSACLSPMELDEFLAGSPQDGRLEAHLATCPACREAVAEQRTNNEMLTRLLTSLRGAPPADAHAASPQLVIAGYEVIEEIHRGAQGVVFRAVQKSANRVVALKVLLTGALATSTQRRRFEREFELVAGLDHPNIVTFFDSGATESGHVYFTMQHIDGMPFNRWLEEHVRQARDQRAARRRALQVFIKACRAVHHAHLHGVIHRDLKPANILIDRSDEPHLVDFGLAKLVGAGGVTAREVTQPGLFVGTAVYASPEQVKGDPSAVDIRSDVYSLGVMLYEMVVG